MERQLGWVYRSADTCTRASRGCRRPLPTHQLVRGAATHTHPSARAERWYTLDNKPLKKTDKKNTHKKHTQKNKKQKKPQNTHTQKKITKKKTKNRRTEERKNGRPEERKNGRTEERKNGRTEERKNGRVYEFSVVAARKDGKERIYVFAVLFRSFVSYFSLFLRFFSVLFHSERQRTCRPKNQTLTKP